MKCFRGARVKLTCDTPAAATSSSSLDMVALLSAANADTLHATQIFWPGLIIQTFFRYSLLCLGRQPVHHIHKPERMHPTAYTVDQDDRRAWTEHGKRSELHAVQPSQQMQQMACSTA